MKAKLLSVLARVGLFLILILPASMFAASNVVTMCGIVITSPGTWTLANNLTCAGEGIDIQVSNVILKLNGFIISGPGASSGNGNGVLIVSSGGTGLKMVTILGPGTVTNFPAGIAFTGATGGGAVDVNLTNNAAGLLLNSDKLGVASTGLLISRNNIQKNFQGISAGGLTTSTIVGNNCSNNGDGIGLGSSGGNKLLGNTCNDNNHAGIVLGGVGSSGSTGNTLEGNQTSNNGFYGIFLGDNADGNHLLGNEAFGNHFLDINDENFNCGTNTYKRDVFGTADRPCVR